MDTKLDARQGQFPANFPDTFKDFFAIMSEDEDHIDLLSSLLEDKVIPRASTKYGQRRCGGSLRCTSHSARAAFGASRTGDVVTRSNSFRMNRPRNLLSNSQSQNSEFNAGAVSNQRQHRVDSTDSNGTFRKHLQYCCLHQSTQAMIPLKQQKQQQEHSAQLQQQKEFQVFHWPSPGDERVEPEGEDNCKRAAATTSGGAVGVPIAPAANLKLSNSFQQLRTGHDRRHSIILERSLDLDVNNDESEAKPATATYQSYRFLKPILKQTHQHLQQQRSEQQRSEQQCTARDVLAPTGHRLLPQPPIGRGAHHTKQEALQRIQQQSGMFGSKTNLATVGAIRPGATDEVAGDDGLNGSTVSGATTNYNAGGGVSSEGLLLATGSANQLEICPSEGGKAHTDHTMAGSRSNFSSIHCQKSPILMRRRSSSIVANALVIAPPTQTHALVGNAGSAENVAINMRVASTTNVGASNGIAMATSTSILASSKQRQRMRTSSMPAESRKPRLADTRRAAIHCADIDLEYYRLRSFSITSHGVCHLGDSLRSRRSRSINSVTSTTTSNSGKDRNNSNASRTSGDLILEQVRKRDAAKDAIAAYKIAMLGFTGVGKTTLTYQFTTSDYISAYDLSLDDDYGQKTVSVLLNGIETDLEIIDHPACEMSTEAFCSTYNIDLFVVVYSVADRTSFKGAEKMLKYLKENEMLLSRGAILVGNKTDLERHREVSRQMGRKLAKEVACKFIETSAGLDHNVDELLVGCVAQVKLNVQRLSNLSDRDRQRLNLQSTIQKHRCMHLAKRRVVRQISMCQADDSEEESHERHRFDSTIEGSERTVSTSLSSTTCASTGAKSAAPGSARKTHRRTINLESILKMGESELEEDEDLAEREIAQMHATPLSKFDRLVNRNRQMSSKCSIQSLEFQSDKSSPKYRQIVDRASASMVCRNPDASPVNDLVVAAAETEVANSVDSNQRTVSKFTNRTKVFLTSVLKFKKNISAKRRNSSSCSDLFVI